MSKKTIKVGYLARVEGEGSLYIKTNGELVEDVKLKIFEPPRFFEGFLKSRSYEEAPDMTARICGICPVAYQMSTVHAIEDAFGLEIPHHISQLRRLIYCGEWIESHTLHALMLHAPDFMKVPDVLGLVKINRKQVEAGLRLKKIGNKIIEVLGGREIHPINVKVGGFYRLPPKEHLSQLKSELLWAKQACIELSEWISSFQFPKQEFDYEFVSLKSSVEYPFNHGNIESNKNLKIQVSEFENHFEEVHVPHSTALQSVRKGSGSYLTGPMARWYHNFEELYPEVKSLAKKLGIGNTCNNPYRSIQIRILEVYQAFIEADRIIDEYNDGLAAAIKVTPKSGEGFAATEAPRGLLYHHFLIDEQGLIKYAKIVPPTSQNQRRIEDDLREVVRLHINDSEAALTHRCEQTIRNYDPCISCSTHFLKLNIDRR